MTKVTKRQRREAQQASYLIEGQAQLPKKKFYRQRAHANPFSDHALTYPTHPGRMDWSAHFPAYCRDLDPAGGSSPKQPNRNVTVADIGCGFGGLLVALSELLHSDLILGMEIRSQVTDYVSHRIHALREQHASCAPAARLPSHESHALPPGFQNISVIRANSMKFLPNFFPRASLKHIFLCFPDPHFKARKHKARIVSETLCSEYAYVLQPGGLVWSITDVEDLAVWMGGHFLEFGKNAPSLQHDSATPSQRGLFEAVEVPEEGKELDWTESEIGHLAQAIRTETEEGKKVSRNRGKKFVKVWRRRDDPPWIEEAD